MADNIDYKQLGYGIAILTFGVALGVFIYAVQQGIISSISSMLLYISSFLLMLRFWFRYAELFIQYLPSRSYWQFLADFAISFFGILAVLFAGNIQVWALIGILAMASSIVRSGLSWKDADNEGIKNQLKRTLYGAVFIAAVFSVVYSAAFFIDSLPLSAFVLAFVVIFVVYASREKNKVSL